VQRKDRTVKKLIRASFSIEEPLYRELERILRKRGYANRSEFIRDMIREKLVESEWKQDRRVIGTITIIYRHGQRTLTDKLTRLQHKEFRSVLAATHVHLDHDLCAEAILVRGRASRIREMCHLLGQQKGVLHAALSLGSLGKDLP
jgi:CopG family nickel-responsive transcriptional regulator